MKYKILFFIVWVMYGLIRLQFIKKCKNTNAIVVRNKIHEKIKVFLSALGLIFFPMIYLFTNWLNIFNMNLSETVRIIGFLGLFADCIFFYFIHKELSTNWSPVLEIQENQKLVTNGIYSKIRHPMYLQCWLWVIFQMLLISNWVVGIMGIGTWALLYFTRIGKEEKMMIEQFGDEYKTYMNKTGRLFPKFSI